MAIVNGEPLVSFYADASTGYHLQPGDILLDTISNRLHVRLKDRTIYFEGKSAPTTLHLYTPNKGVLHIPIEQPDTLELQLTGSDWEILLTKTNTVIYSSSISSFPYVTGLTDILSHYQSADSIYLDTNTRDIDVYLTYGNEHGEYDYHISTDYIVDQDNNIVGGFRAGKTWEQLAADDNAWVCTADTIKHIKHIKNYDEDNETSDFITVGDLGYIASCTTYDGENWNFVSNVVSTNNAKLIRSTAISYSFNNTVESYFETDYGNTHSYHLDFVRNSNKFIVKFLRDGIAMREHSIDVPSDKELCVRIDDIADPIYINSTQTVPLDPWKFANISVVDLVTVNFYTPYQGVRTFKYSNANWASDSTVGFDVGLNMNNKFAIGGPGGEELIEAPDDELYWVGLTTNFDFDINFDSLYDYVDTSYTDIKDGTISIYIIYHHEGSDDHHISTNYIKDSQGIFAGFHRETEDSKWKDVAIVPLEPDSDSSLERTSFDLEGSSGCMVMYDSEGKGYIKQSTDPIDGTFQSNTLITTVSEIQYADYVKVKLENTLNSKASLLKYLKHKDAPSNINYYLKITCRNIADKFKLQMAITPTTQEYDTPLETTVNKGNTNWEIELDTSKQYQLVFESDEVPVDPSGHSVENITISTAAISSGSSIEKEIMLYNWSDTRHANGLTVRLREAQ